MLKQKRRQKDGQKKIYRIRNWPEYNESLKQRGSLEIWLASEAQTAWYAEATGEPGKPAIYSDAAITCCLSLRKLFKLPLRQTQGFVRSVFKQTYTELTAPDYTTLSRRSRFLLVKLPKDASKKKVRIIVDSTGAKVVGEGEWKVRKHGAERRRGWKKIHVAIDDDGEVRATEVTDEDTGDSSVAKTLLDQEEAVITAAFMDGAYDKRKVYDELEERNVAHVAIPPQKNAKIWRHGNRAGPKHARDENLRQIRKRGRPQWEEDSNYHQRSLVENTMFRYKTIFSEKVLSREDSRQQTELKLGFSMLNTMFQLGMPDSYVVTV
jgi:hypothetical protein